MQKRAYQTVSIIGVLVAVAAIAGTIAYMASQGSMALNGASVFGALTDQKLSIGAIKELSMSGLWEVKVQKGEPAIQLQADAEQLKHVRFSEQAGKVELVHETGFWIPRPIKATISVSELEYCRLEGLIGFDASGLVLPELRLELEGASTVVVSDSSIDLLDLTIDGAASADFSAASVKNAKVSLDGASHTRLNLAGGTLEGSINGLGSLSYRGQVASVKVDTDGLASVNQEE